MVRATQSVPVQLNGLTVGGSQLQQPLYGTLPPHLSRQVPLALPPGLVRLSPLAPLAPSSEAEKLDEQPRHTDNTAKSR